MLLMGRVQWKCVVHTANEHTFSWTCLGKKKERNAIQVMWESLFSFHGLSIWSGEQARWKLGLCSSLT